MDSIDIIDPQFSLNIPDSLAVISDSMVVPDIPEIPNVNEITFANHQMDSKIIGGDTSRNDYTMFIYIVAAFFLGLIGMFAYKKYVENKNKRNNSNINNLEDCPGGFCTMKQNKMI